MVPHQGCPASLNGGGKSQVFRGEEAFVGSSLLQCDSLCVEDREHSCGISHTRFLHSDPSASKQRNESQKQNGFMGLAARYGRVPLVGAVPLPHHSYFKKLVSGRQESKGILSCVAYCDSIPFAFAAWMSNISWWKKESQTCLGKRIIPLAVITREPPCSWYHNYLVLAVNSCLIQESDEPSRAAFCYLIGGWETPGFTLVVRAGKRGHKLSSH